jgi:hypothetical protein
MASQLCLFNDLLRKKGRIMEYKLKTETDIVADTYPLMPVSSEMERKLHYLLDALDCMDARIAQQLELLSQSDAEEDLKEAIRQDIVSHHEERRGPIAAAVEELRERHRASMVTEDA